MPPRLFYGLSLTYCVAIIVGIYFLHYGLGRPHIWDVYPFNGEARPQ
jgi:hypothetical protein